MSFLKGRVTCLRFAAAGTPSAFTEDHVRQLEEFAVGRQRVASADGVECGWAAGNSVLDTAFALEKQVYPEHLAFEFRVDTDRLPGDLLRAYTAVEFEALAKDNPSGRPSARQKREAKETARSRLEQEAKDGRFKKRKCYPVLWDAVTGEVLVGATSAMVVDRFLAHFEATFGITLAAIDAGTLAADHAPLTAASVLSAFVPAAAASDGPAWLVDAEDARSLGNEFLLWLWYTTDAVGDTITLADDSEVTLMFARKLRCDCPRGMTGTDAFTHEGPARMPEARRAVREGKLPRVAGLTVVHRNEQYEFTLQAETFAVTGAKLPAYDGAGGTPRDVAEHRFAATRSLLAALDATYGIFLSLRTDGRKWPAVLAAMREWLGVGKAA